MPDGSSKTIISGSLNETTVLEITDTENKQTIIYPEKTAVEVRRKDEFLDIYNSYTEKVGIKMMMKLMVIFDKVIEGIAKTNHSTKRRFIVENFFFKVMPNFFYVSNQYPENIEEAIVEFVNSSACAGIFVSWDNLEDDRKDPKTIKKYRESLMENFVRCINLKIRDIKIGVNNGVVNNHTEVKYD